MHTVYDRLTCIWPSKRYAGFSGQKAPACGPVSRHLFEDVRGLWCFFPAHVREKTNLNPIAKSEEIKAEQMLGQLYRYYMDHIDILPPKFLKMMDEGEDKGRVVCDFIAGMTDQFAINRFTEFYLPKAWQVDGF